MDDGLPEAFSKTERGLIITPAGCGKTEIIARAVSFSDKSKGKQLILTHTHAGVKSIYDRLRKLGVSRKYYHIDTIAGFALQFAASFPLSSLCDYNDETRVPNKLVSRAQEKRYVSRISRQAR